MNENKFKKYANPGACPVRNIIAKIGDKWSILVLMVLEDGEVLRFNEINAYIETISQKMLSVTLKSLEADGLIKRTVYPQIPPKVEYELTQRGKSLLPHLHKLAEWAVTNMAEIKKSRNAYLKSAV